jgi:hypothetical protein
MITMSLGAVQGQPNPLARLLPVGLAVLIGAAGFTPACAQAPAAPASTPRPTSAQEEAGEPRADATAPAGDASAAAGTAPSAAGNAGGAASSAAGAGPSASASTGAPSAALSGSSRARDKTADPHASGKAKPGGVDRLDLGTATVTGDREQPKVMYIVPWKRSDIGDLSGKPMNSLLDEAIAPVDRDEFKREVIYYNVVKSDASQNGAPTPAPKGEK